MKYSTVMIRFFAILIVEVSLFQNSYGDERVSLKKCNEYGRLLYKEVSPMEREYICKKPRSSRGRIIGGRNSTIREFPHMALLGHKSGGSDPEFYCGGSLISENFILTAAHCSYNSQTKKSTNYARLDTLVRNSGVDRFGTYIIHPKYKTDSKNNDIALFKLDESISFVQHQNFTPACLYTKDDISFRSQAIATGWGALEFAASTPTEFLQKVTLTMINCKSRNKKLVNTICANGNGKDTCSGDSGGPLQLRRYDSDGKYTCQMNLIGLTSSGSTQCGEPGAYGIYTKVSDFLDWIEENVWPEDF